MKSTPALEREIDRGVRVGIIVSQAPLPKEFVAGLTARSVSCLIFVAPEKSAEIRAARRSTSVHWLEPERVPRSLARAVTIALIEDLLIRALDAVARSPLFVGFDGLHEALKHALASPTPPMEPVASVSKVARLAHCSRRWVDMSWVRVCERSGRPHPTLRAFLVVIIFLKGLRLWLMHEPLRDCARHLGITDRTLHDYFVQLAGQGPSEVDVYGLPALLVRIEREYFSWLLEH